MSLNSLTSRKNYSSKFLFGSALCLILFVLSYLPKYPLSLPQVSTSPVPPAPAHTIKQFFSETEVEKLFQTPPLSSLPVHEAKFEFTSDGMTKFSGKLDTVELSRISSTAQSLSPAGAKLLNTLPVNSDIQVWGLVTVTKNELKIKVSRLQIAGITISSYILNADKLISQWFSGYLLARPGLQIERLYAEKDRLYIEAQVPSGFVLFP